MDWKFWLTLAVNLVGLWLMWRADQKQARYMNPQAVQNAIAALPWYTALWKRYWPIFIMFLMMIGSWTPYLIKGDVRPPKDLFVNWGSVPPDKVVAVINTVSVAANKDKDRVMLMCRVVDNSVDARWDQTMEKSRLFDIVGGNQTMVITVSPAFMPHMRAVGIYYIELFVVTVPKNVVESDITTLNDIERLGGKKLGSTGFGAAAMK